MRRRFRHAQLKNKLTTIIMMISLVVVCLGAGSFILAEVLSYRQALISRLASTAGVISANTYPSLLLHKRYEAERVLATLANSRDIAAAYIFTIDQDTFASYLNSEILGESDLALAELDKNLLEQALDRHTFVYAFNRQQAQLCAPISSDENLTGAICLQSDLAPLYRLISQFTLGTLAVCTLLGLVAYLLSTRLQEMVTQPIARLAKTIQSVAQKQDFKVRAEKTSNDEIGDLVDGFNAMLVQLALRDTQLEEHRHNLERQVEERTKQLQTTNAELKKTIADLDQMRQAAERANQAKSMFLAKMSHEIRTPMIGIMGMAEQLATAELPAHQHQMAIDVQHSGETLLGILDDVLDFSRIEAGRMELEHIPFSLLSVCEEVASLFAGEAHKKGLEIICFVATACRGPYRGDPVRVRQILNNLIGNAIKFTRQGHVLLRAEPLPDGRVRLQVIDTGIGIPETAQQTIFDSFSQADNSMARKFGGSGLGLAIVAQLTALMQGDCRVSSSPDQGSRFEIDLPLETAPEIEELAWSCPKTVSGSALIIAPNPHLRSALESALSDAGMVVFADSTSGAETASRSDIDFLLIDEKLLQDNDRLSQALLRSERPTRFILLTTGSGSKTAREHIDRGRLTLLHKPVRLSELFAALTAPGSRDETRCTTPTPRHGNILLVEDNPTTQRLVHLILDHAGYQLDHCDNGNQALLTVAGKTYDLILMDCEMPGLNGFDTTHTLRERDHTEPIVALTAHVGNDIFDRCRQAGMDDILHKPFRQRELLSLVEKWIPHHRKNRHAQ